MLIVRVILAATAVGALSLWPDRSRSAFVIAAAAGADVACGGPVTPAVTVVAPLMAFLGAALTLATVVARSGLVERAAARLAARAGGNARALYALVCALCVVLTAAISLDGAVVLMVPLLLALARRSAAPLAPLFIGVVAVANAASIAVPQGNPTNLVVIERLGISPRAFLTHMLVPGLAAAALCAMAVAVSERRALATPYRAAPRDSSSLSCDERHAAVALAAATLSAWLAPLVGAAPWWPFTATVVTALAAHRGCRRFVVPWRVGGQVGGLLIVMSALPWRFVPPPIGGLTGLLAIAAGVGAVSAIANNLPASIWAAAALASPAAYAATVGLAIGSLATPHGSVATLIAGQIAGPHAPPLTARRLAPLAVITLLPTTVLLWALS
jgi:arsenical pump membrane protein